MSINRWGSRAITITAATGLFVLVSVGSASAHVTAHSPDQPVKGTEAEITFRVPAEEATAGTIKLQVNFPLDTPIADVDTKPVPGWTAQVNMVKLATPVNMTNYQVTEAVQSISWTAQSGTRLNPGEFQEFSIVAQLPTNTDELVMPATQTYDNGDVVNWNQQATAGGTQSEHPAPHIDLVSAGAAMNVRSNGSGAPSTADQTARWLGGAGLVLGVLGFGLGLGALARGRRWTASSSTEQEIPKP